MSIENRYTFRRSCEKDAAIIDDLIHSRFGPRPTALSDITNRYLLCFDGNKLIAMSGINKSSPFNGYEVDWTCVHYDYEGQGLMQRLFQKLLDEFPKDTNIYWSAWRYGNCKQPNAIKSLNHFGFELAIPSSHHYVAEHLDCKNTCVHYTPKCECFEDVYVLRYVR